MSSIFYLIAEPREKAYMSAKIVLIKWWFSRVDLWEWMRFDVGRALGKLLELIMLTQAYGKTIVF